MNVPIAFIVQEIPKPVISILQLLIITVSFWLFYHYRFKSKVTLFHAKKLSNVKYRSPVDKRVKSMSLDQLIKVCCPSLVNGIYASHPLLFNGHMQTVYASIYADFIAVNRVEFKREFLTTSDGGIISLDWTDEPTKSNVNTPYVFILHGLTGGSHETYVQDLILELKKYKYKCIVMNFRGCSGTPVQSAQLYSGSFTGDLKMCLEHVKQRDPSAVIFGCGFSLGSSVLTKYVGQMGDKCPLIGMVSVGNPYDFLGSLRALHRSFLGRNMYSYKMGRNLSKVLFKNCEWLDFAEVANAKSIMDFDAAATSKQFGYKTVHEYYRFGSSAQDIPYITIPGLFLTSMDDPVSNREVIPYYEIASNPNTILATTDYGGHLGWFKWNGHIVPRERWFQAPVAEFVHAILESHLSLPPGVVKEKKKEWTGTPWYSMPRDAMKAREELKRLRQIVESAANAAKEEKNVQTEDVGVVAVQVHKVGEVISDVPEKVKELETAIVPEQTKVTQTAVKEKKLPIRVDPKTKPITIWQRIKTIRISRLNFIFFLLGYLLRRK